MYENSTRSFNSLYMNVYVPLFEIWPAYFSPAYFSNVEQFKPKILVLNYKRVFSGKETEDFSLSYNVSSYPVTNIYWWRSKDGVRYQLITRCLVTAQICKKLDKGDENITKTSFQMKDIKFPQDDLFYKLNAINRKGNDSKIFRIQVLGKANDVHILYGDK
jgi:hypothetical protein